MIGWVLFAIALGSVALGWPWINRWITGDPGDEQPDPPFDDWADEMRDWPVLDEEPEVLA